MKETVEQLSVHDATEQVTEYIAIAEGIDVLTLPQFGPHPARVLIEIELPFNSDVGIANMDDWADHVATCPICQERGER